MTSPPRIVPAHVIVLVVLAALAIIAGHRAGVEYQAARASGDFPAHVRRVITFGALFNAGALGILVGAWLAELVAATVAFLRSPPWRSRILVRLAVALIPLVAFGVGHLVANPWGMSLLRQVRTAVRSG